ncbi:hypothetical protein [Pseudactinotalea sp. Z1732]|uniref:hypothetical protein n=1 Tax=Pseudactinotalea sp. Z1732 TaxID=3413026 RepID=UPI003C7EB1D0
MKRRSVSFVAVLTYTWLQIMLFGGLVAETLLVYPNVFADIPRSFEATMEFMQVTDPGLLFPPFGAATILVGLIALVLVWRTRAVRYLLASSLAAFGLGNALFSVLFAWPRNVIMFEEGAQVHSVSYLEQIAQEFVLGHWVRLVASLITAILAGAGFLTLSRRRLTAG